MSGPVRDTTERTTLLAEYKASGLSAKAFAEQAQVPSSTFYQWLSAEGRRARGSMRVVRVVRRSEQKPVDRGAVAQLVVELSSARLHIHDGFSRETLAVVLDVLETRPRARS